MEIKDYQKIKSQAKRQIDEEVIEEKEEEQFDSEGEDIDMK